MFWNHIQSTSPRRPLVGQPTAKNLFGRVNLEPCNSEDCLSRGGNTETVAELLNHSANNSYENRPKEYGYQENHSRGDHSDQIPAFWN